MIPGGAILARLIARLLGSTTGRYVALVVLVAVVVWLYTTRRQRERELARRAASIIERLKVENDIHQMDHAARRELMLDWVR